jgi:hypothetical protein
VTDIKKATKEQRELFVKQIELQEEQLKYQRERDAKNDEDRRRITDLFCEYLMQKIREGKQ